jgi:hypothetical protein
MSLKMATAKVEPHAQEKDEKPLRNPMRKFAHPLCLHKSSPRRRSSTSLISLEGAISSLVLPSSSELSLGDNINEEDGMEQESKAIVDLSAVEEPTLPAFPAEVEVPLPKELRAPTAPSPIWVPASYPWPLEVAAAPGLVGVGIKIPPPADWEEEEEVVDEMDLDLGESLLDGASDILGIHPGGNGDIEFDGDNPLGLSHSGMMPETDDALQLNDDLVGHEDGDVYVRNDDDDDDDNERDDDLRHVDEMSHHVFVALPPNPEPTEGGLCLEQLPVELEAPPTLGPEKTLRMWLHHCVQ